MSPDPVEPCQHRMAGIFEFYSLNSLNQSPKSGYDIIKEIREKSRGNIVASKGAIYPMLDRLTRDKLLKVDDTFARGRKVFSLTAKGRSYLKDLDKRERNIRNKMKYMPFLFAEYKGDHSGLDSLLFRLFVHVEECPKKHNDRIKSQLTECLKKIEALE
jgi:DNA-binding PadR family transcriptional regulator